MNSEFPRPQARIYKLDKNTRRRLLKAEERAEIERRVLDAYQCPHCGCDEEPFLDYFDLAMKIECVDCNYPGVLSEFLDTDQ